MASSLSGQVALVSGGANGIGRATVERLAAAGARIVFTDIDDDAGRRTQREVSGDVRYIHADATREEDVANAVEAAIGAHGRLDILVNNVGNFGAGDSSEIGLEDLELAIWDNTVRQCLTTCMLGMKHALRPMLAAGRGTIVNIASLAGIRVTPYASYAYHAAKAGVVHLSEASAVLYAARGIRVNVVAPGLTLTPNLAERMDAATRTTIAAHFHPMGRMIDPGEIADAILWATSPQSSGVTGLVIPVDGGWAAK